MSKNIVLRCDFSGKGEIEVNTILVNMINRLDSIGGKYDLELCVEREIEHPTGSRFGDDDEVFIVSKPVVVITYDAQLKHKARMAITALDKLGIAHTQQ